MNDFEKSLEVLKDLFAKDCQFALATSKDNIPNLRMVDVYYDDSCFWIVTYAKSNKVIEIESNENVAMCCHLYQFSGKACNAGHPLNEENKAIRDKLIKAFEPWYFAHNNEQDENMCYVRVKLTHGFFFKDGVGYKVDFENKTAVTFPFEDYIVNAD